MLTLEAIQQAQTALAGIVRVTPLTPAPKIGANVWIKSENLQLTGAFKIRGAYNKIRSLTPEEAKELAGSLKPSTEEKPEKAENVQKAKRTGGKAK